MNQEQFLKESEELFRAIALKLKEELRMIRSNRPSLDLLENLKVSVYNDMLPIKQLGSLGIVPPREVTVSVWDKTAVSHVMKAIQEASLGFTVSNDGNVIRATLPALTNERREELGRLVKKTAENARIQLRGRRDEAMKKIKTAEEKKETSEDATFKLREKIQKFTDERNKEIELLVEGKLKELSE